MAEFWNQQLFNEHQDDQAEYRTKNEENLELISDQEPWNPDARIREVVKNFDLISVELLTGSSNLNIVNKDLRSARSVGLLLLGPIISRKRKPSLIVLACVKKLYAFDPDEPKLVKFLQLKLTDKAIEFWTTNGLEESDCLYNFFRFKLNRPTVQCCTATHLHLMETMALMPEQARLFYPPLATQESRKRPRIEKFERLVEIWLDVDKSSFFSEHEKLAHLNSRPLSLTAINIILKRCILIRPLVLALKDACQVELRNMCKETFERLQMYNKPGVDSVIAGMKQNCQDKGMVDLGYYSHLELGRTHKVSLPF